jgi:orotate phosphoribosyltransferase
MNTEDVLTSSAAPARFAKAISSWLPGGHSPMFLQKNLVFQYPGAHGAPLQGAGREDRGPVRQARRYRAPAVGAIIPGYEVARWLDVPSIYVEREDGKFKLAAPSRSRPAPRSWWSRT